MRIQDTVRFLQSHHVRTGMTMEWFEFSHDESTKASEVLSGIKSEFSTLNGINLAQIGKGKVNKTNLGFGLTREQYSSILKAVSVSSQSSLEHSPVKNLSPYEAQMDFLHFYIVYRFEIDELAQQQKLESFFWKNPQYTQYKERVYRIKNLEAHQQVFFTSRFLDIPLDHLDDSLRIGYYPYEGIPHKQYNYDPRQILLASDGFAAREYSKHRLVYGPVDFYLQGKNAITFNVITACAPNLMGTSPNDEQKFLDVFGNLHTVNYVHACEELANFIVKAAHDTGNARLVMPAFGVGAYINIVPVNQKPEAVQIMYEAFARAAQNHKINIDWIVWSREKNTYLQKDFLDNLKGENPFINNIPHEDMLSYAADQVGQGIRCAILNAGSDRTIGGKFISKNPTTVEEQLAQQSDLMLLQTVYNVTMIHQFENNIQSALEAQKQMQTELHYGAIDSSEEEFDPTTPYRFESETDLEEEFRVHNNTIATMVTDSEVGVPVELSQTQTNAYFLQLEAVDRILAKFKDRIDSIGFYKSEARQVAVKLLEDLSSLKQTCFNNPTQQSLTYFAKNSELLIKNAEPELQKDLSWSDYLMNMLKQLINAVTIVCSFGQHQGFFAIKSSDAAQSASQLNQELQTELSI